MVFSISMVANYLHFTYLCTARSSYPSSHSPLPHHSHRHCHLVFHFYYLLVLSLWFHLNLRLQVSLQLSVCSTCSLQSFSFFSLINLPLLPISLSPFFLLFHHLFAFLFVQELTIDDVLITSLFTTLDTCCILFLFIKQPLFQLLLWDALILTIPFPLTSFFHDILLIIQVILISQ